MMNTYELCLYDKLQKDFIDSTLFPNCENRDIALSRVKRFLCSQGLRLSNYGYTLKKTNKVKEYSTDLDLLDDNEVMKFLDTYGIEVEENEPDHYVELMMDNHKCSQWKDKQYYISDSLDLSDDEQKIYDILAYELHV